MDAFYAAYSGVSFTLLGLWWTVTQFRRETWMDDPVRRRLGTLIMTNFLSMGLMGIASLIGSSGIWRTAFAATGVFAVAIAVVTMLSPGRPTMLVRALQAGVAALFAVVVVVSFLPDKQDALQAEAVLSTLILFVNAQIVWQFLLEATPTRREQPIDAP